MKEFKIIINSLFSVQFLNGFASVMMEWMSNVNEYIIHFMKIATHKNVAYSLEDAWFGVPVE